jgi:hypothetical protein
MLDDQGSLSQGHDPETGKDCRKRTGLNGREAQEMGDIMVR